MNAKFLGIFDAIALSLFFIHFYFNITFTTVLLFAAYYLISKGIFFFILGDAISGLDILAGVVIFSSLYISLPWVISLITVLFLFQKAILTLV